MGEYFIDFRKLWKATDNFQVLITKLRSANNIETQQYRKAAKALLVLIPLLGVTYILVIVGPKEGIPKRIYDSLRAILLSTQVIEFII